MAVVSVEQESHDRSAPVGFAFEMKKYPNMKLVALDYDMDNATTAETQTKASSPPTQAGWVSSARTGTRSASVRVPTPLV